MTHHMNYTAPSATRLSSPPFNTQKSPRPLVSSASVRHTNWLGCLQARQEIRTPRWRLPHRFGQRRCISWTFQATSRLARTQCPVQVQPKLQISTLGITFASGVICIQLFQFPEPRHEIPVRHEDVNAEPRDRMRRTPLIHTLAAIVCSGHWEAFVMR